MVGVCRGGFGVVGVEEEVDVSSCGLEEEEEGTKTKGERCWRRDSSEIMRW